MQLLSTGSNRCRRLSASVSNVGMLVVLGSLEGGVHSRLDVDPGTSVKRLLLSPADILKVGVRVQKLSDLLPREGVQLLDSDDSSLLVSKILSSLEESSPDLAGTEENSLDALLVVDGLAMLVVLNDPLEVRLTNKLREVGLGHGVSQQVLREEAGQRLSESSVHLSSVQMEDVGGGSGVSNLDVAVLVLSLKLIGRGEVERILVSEQQVSLNSSGRMLGTLSIVSVGQRQNQAGSLRPLGLGGGNELINDDLGSVGEVTKLSLPDDKGLRRSQGVTVLKAHDTVLGKMGVGDGEVGLILGQVVQRNICGLVNLVVDNSVSLREGTSLDILTGKSDVVALLKQSTEGKSLTSGPVNAMALLNGLASVGQDSLEVSVKGESLRNRGDDLSNLLELLLLNRCGEMGQDLGGKLLGGLEVVPRRSEPLLLMGHVVLGLLERLLEHSPDPLLVLLNVLLGKSLLLEKLVDIDVKRVGLVGNLLVHERLSERGLIGLVVTELSVADKIDDDIGLEGSSPVSSQVEDEVDGLHIVSVDVEDGGIDGFSQIGGVGVDRENRGSVVKPIWLLTMMWMVPPVE